MESQIKERKDPIVKLRRVLKSGNSYYIGIPSGFVKRHDIKKGDRLPVLAGQIMKVIPMGEEG